MIKNGERCVGKREHLTLLRNRESLYRFLAGLYRSEVEETDLQRLKGLHFPEESGNVDLSQGYQLMKQSIQEAGENFLVDLAVDYSRVFLGAGIASLEAAYPYESVYTGKKMIMQEARDLAVAAYEAKGFHKAEGINFPEDHVALELEFLACLCKEAREAIDLEEPAIYSIYEEQAVFLERLLKWVPLLCDDIEKYATTNFYMSLAKITRGYLHMDCALLENLTVK